MSQTMNRSQRRANLQKKKSTPQSSDYSQDLNSVSKLSPPSTPDLKDLSNLAETFPPLGSPLSQLSEKEDQQSPISTGEALIPEKVRSPKFAKLEKDLARAQGSIGLSIMIFSPQDGMVLLQRAVIMAARLVDVAEKNAQFAKILFAITEGEVYSALALEVAAMAGAILANHGVDIPGWIKRKFMGEDNNAENTQQDQTVNNSTGAQTARDQFITPDQWFTQALGNA